MVADDGIGVGGESTLRRISGRPSLYSYATPPLSPSDPCALRWYFLFRGALVQQRHKASSLIVYWIRCDFVSFAFIVELFQSSEKVLEPLKENVLSLPPSLQSPLD